MPTHTENYKSLLIPLINKHVPHVTVILYGSRARKDDREGSDIDIALDAGKKIDRSVMSAIIGELEESRLPICFDIVDFHAISERMQKEIIREGVIWQKRNKNY